jgi:hypothetical protein
MFNQYEFDFRGRYYDLVIITLGDEVEGRISLYVLLYSNFSVNYYSDDFIDGHAERRNSGVLFWSVGLFISLTSGNHSFYN